MLLCRAKLYCADLLALSSSLCCCSAWLLLACSSAVTAASCFCCSWICDRHKTQQPVTCLACMCMVMSVRAGKEAHLLSAAPCGSKGVTSFQQLSISHLLLGCLVLAGSF